MSIKFACRCGQHLKARETSAGRLTQCPRCGSPVAVPTGQPTHRGTDELPVSLIRPGRTRRTESPPIQPQAARRTEQHSVRPAADRTQLPSALPTGFDTATSKASGRSATASYPARPQASRTTRSTEIRLRRIPHWWRLCGHQARHAVAFTVSFGFSLGIVPALAALCAILGIVLAGWLRLLPGSLQNAGGVAENPFLGFIGLAAVGLAAYCALLLNRVLRAAARPLEGPGRFQMGLDTAVCALAVWIGCFLAGPVLPAAAAYVYWLRCGDPSLLDAIVLAELLIPAAGGWLIALTIVNAEGRLRDAVPTRVCETAWRLGRTAALAAVAACFVLSALTAALFHAARLIHQDDAAGYLLLPVALTTAALATTALFRVLGAAYARTCQQPASAASSAASAHSSRTWSPAPPLQRSA